MSNQTLKFYVEWPQDLDANLYGGSEDVTVTLERGGWDDEFLQTLQEGIRDLLKEQFDNGATVLTEAEYDAEIKRQEAATPKDDEL